MLLAFDVGNSNIVLGVFKDGNLLNNWRIETDNNKSADEYGMIVNQLFSYEGLKMSDIDDVIISTVVPSVLYTLQHLADVYKRQTLSSAKRSCFTAALPPGAIFRGGIT